jgi:hypothetical protein
MRIVLFALLTACTAPDFEVGEVQQGILYRCDTDFCGTNSPLLTANATWEFSIKGRRNGQGFRILGLGKGAEFYDLVVKDSRILGLDAHGNVALSYSKLIGARIYLEQKGKQSAIQILDAASIQEVVYPHDRIGSYVLDWGDVVAHPLPDRMLAGQIAEGGIEPVLGPTDLVCPPPKWIEEPHVGSMMEWEETMYGGMLPFQSVVFEGDRFNPESRTVRQLPDESWFNIGCGLHTLAKLRLTRNTIMKTNWTNVQAALKMLGADYCGGGTTFTFPGEPLLWRDRGTMIFRQVTSKV